MGDGGGDVANTLKYQGGLPLQENAVDARMTDLTTLSQEQHGGKHAKPRKACKANTGGGEGYRGGTGGLRVSGLFGEGSDTAANQQSRHIDESA